MFKVTVSLLLLIGIISCSIDRNTKKSQIEVVSAKDVKWNNQIKITNLDVHIVDCKGDVFFVTYNVSGQIELLGNRADVIKTISINDYLINDPKIDYSRVIKIVPITKYVGKKNSGQILEPFSFKNKYSIKCNGDTERVKFICGDKEQIIELKYSRNAK